MNAGPLAAACRWADPGGREAAERILGFLDGIGLAVTTGVPEGGLLPGLALKDGGVIVDPSVAVWPGDLLHEAGHIAVTEPEQRPDLADPGGDPASEMAALAWSAAAAKACGVGLDVVFHDHGYKGGAARLAEAFGAGNGPGVPMLAWYGMTIEPHRAAPGQPGFPVMQRWLR